MTCTELRTLQIGNDCFLERPGGLNRFFSELLNALPGVDVRVRGLVAGGEQVEQATKGAMVGFASAKAALPERLLRARSAGLTVLREEQPDLIACHFALYGLPLLDQLRVFPTIIHFHGPWAGESHVEGQLSIGSKLKAAIERAVYARGRRFIVLSQAFAKELSSHYGVRENEVRVVPGGVDLRRFDHSLSRAQARMQLGWPTDRPIVLSVRRQMRRMGLENLIDAVLHVRQTVPEVLVLLAGSGPLSDHLLEQISARGLQQNVKLLGRVDDRDLPAAYRAADLSIVPSQALEGFGMITLESLACGTPVLVTPVGGLPEVIQPFAPQCVLEGTSTEIIGEALGEFLRGQRRLPDSEACRCYVTGKYAWPVIAERTRRVYEEALA